MLRLEERINQKKQEEEEERARQREREKREEKERQEERARNEERARKEERERERPEAQKKQASVFKMPRNPRPILNEIGTLLNPKNDERDWD